LLKAEAINGIIESTGDMEIANARKMYFQEDVPIKEWKEKLKEICATIETIIEFEEDNNLGSKENGIEKTKKIIGEIEKEIKKREIIKNVDNTGIVVIAGPVNAGKSSLFNVLLGKNRSIVHREPGTTRDLVSEHVWICGYLLKLIDSAGIRETDVEIEKEGIIRTKGVAKEAGIVLWVTESNMPFSENEIKEIKETGKEKIICVINKIDQGNEKEKRAEAESLGLHTIAFSVKEKKNIDSVCEIIGKKQKEIYDNTESANAFFNQRQEAIGMALYKELCAARDCWRQPEIAAFHLKKGLDCIDEIYGKTDAEEILEEVFKTFCIGK